MEFRLQQKKTGIVMLILLTLALIVSGCDSAPPEPTVEDNLVDTNHDADEVNPPQLETPPVEETTSDDVDKVFTLTGQNFKFVMDGVDNPELRVFVGDKVRIEFNPTEGFHDWKVDEFGATERVRAGTPTFVEFVADKAGIFEYYCSVGSHRQQGMKGMLVVE